MFANRYAQEFGQTESTNILTQFIGELDRRNVGSMHANDPNYKSKYGENEEDISLPPLGQAFNGNDQGIYDDPEAIQYALPMVHGTNENIEPTNNHNYSVKYINQVCQGVYLITMF